MIFINGILIYYLSFEMINGYVNCDIIFRFCGEVGGYGVKFVL